jgi:hypothetical protein
MLVELILGDTTEKIQVSIDSIKANEIAKAALSVARKRLKDVTPRVFAQCQIVLINHLITPLTNLDDHRSTLGQNPSSKPLLFPLTLDAILELWHVLQNFPKHYKTTQREKCAKC